MTEPSPAPLITRRRVLGAGLAGASALAVSGTGMLRAGAQDLVLRNNGLPRFPEQSGIEHVVVVMMENRSFDHMLGWLPGSRGKQSGLKYVDSAGVTHRTWHLDTFTGDGFSDPSHSFNGGRVEFNDGKCDGWLRAGNNDIFSIGYYTADDLAFYGSAAPYWTVCDHFFSSFMGPTYPNRFYMHSAQTDRQTNTFDISTLPTIWDSLQAAGRTGRYYYSDLPFIALYGQKHLPIAVPYQQLVADCASGSLPNVSFVDPRFLTTETGIQNDDHPHADIRRGQHFLNEVYNAVTTSPNWPNTVLVITYDEWGGFFDHVPPRVVPDANPAWGLRGFRIPGVVISPLARRGYVPHRNYDPTSILKMIEWRWGLPALSPRDAAARNLAEVLDFRTPPDLTAPQWDVPDIDEAPTPSALAFRSGASLTAQQQEHLDEWERIGELAASYGFAV
jgi:phospholipase C